MTWTLHLHGESAGPDAVQAEDSIREKIRELWDLIVDHGQHRTGGSLTSDSGISDTFAHDPHSTPGEIIPGDPQGPTGPDPAPEQAPAVPEPAPAPTAAAEGS